MSRSLQPHGLQKARISLWDFPGKNTGEGCQFLLQGIEPVSPVLAGKLFPTESAGKPPISFETQQFSSLCTISFSVTIPNHHDKHPPPKNRSSQFLMLLVGVTSLTLSSFPASSLTSSSTDLAFQPHRTIRSSWTWYAISSQASGPLYVLFPLSIRPPFRTSPS